MKKKENFTRVSTQNPSEPRSKNVKRIEKETREKVKEEQINKNEGKSHLKK